MLFSIPVDHSSSGLDRIYVEKVARMLNFRTDELEKTLEECSGIFI
jgi:hypothetical protein